MEKWRIYFAVVLDNVNIRWCLNPWSLNTKVAFKYCYSFTQALHYIVAVWNEFCQWKFDLMAILVFLIYQYPLEGSQLEINFSSENLIWWLTAVWDFLKFNTLERVVKFPLSCSTTIPHLFTFPWCFIYLLINIVGVFFFKFQFKTRTFYCGFMISAWIDAFLQCL